MRGLVEVNVQGTAYCMRNVGQNMGQNRMQYAALRNPGCEDHLAGLVLPIFLHPGCGFCQIPAYGMRFCLYFSIQDAVFAKFPHTVCGRKNKTPHIVCGSPHTVCGPRIQYAVPAYGMRFAHPGLCPKWAGSASSMRGPHPVCGPAPSMR